LIFFVVGFIEDHWPGGQKWLLFSILAMCFIRVYAIGVVLIMAIKKHNLWIGRAGKLWKWSCWNRGYWPII